MKKIIILVTLFLNLSTLAALTFEELGFVKQALYETYEEIKPNNNETLIINRIIPGLSPSYWWDIDMIHASYVKMTNEDQSIEHNIYLMGGFVRLPLMTMEGLLVTGCHEIGHGIGGAPFKSSNGLGGPGSSTEGQSDFFATSICLPIAITKLSNITDLSKFEAKPIYDNICSKQALYDMGLCQSMLFALESDIGYFKYLGEEASLETFSTHVQEQLDLSPSFYPSSQCRLDTMINGILGLERPECWFPGGERNGTLR